MFNYIRNGKVHKFLNGGLSNADFQNVVKMFGKFVNIEFGKILKAMTIDMCDQEEIWAIVNTKEYEASCSICKDTRQIQEFVVVVKE